VTARLHPALSSAGILALLMLALFGDVLLGGASAVLSAEGADIVTYFLPLREFGFRELRAGSFPLWDPYTYSGTPYAANFQAALFYPPSWLHLVVAAPTAFNAIFALHWFLAAWFTALWCRRRGAGPGAALLGGLAFACSGAFFLRIYAGHVTMFCAAAWIPLILCSVDAIVVEERPRWLLAGIPAAAMTLLAGYPQIFYYAGVASGLLVLVHLHRDRRDARAFALVAAMFLGAALLASVQLLPGLALAAESTRAKGVSYGFASMFAFPPENLITLFTPAFFGGQLAGYVGRSYLWEASLFAGAAACVLALHGALVAPGGRRVALAIAALLLLALGPSVPVFRLLYDYVPGYRTFRVTARFTLMAAPLIALLAALGLDQAARGTPASRRFVGAVAVVALLLAALGAWLRADAADTTGAWASLVRALASTGQVMALPQGPTASVAIAVAGRDAGGQLVVAAAIFLATAVILGLARSRSRLAMLAGAIAAAELLVMARLYRKTVAPTASYFRAWSEVARVAPDDRFLHAAYGNFGLLRGVSDANGYDPITLARYARFLAVSQGIDPATVDWAPSITRVSRLFEMLRVRHVFYVTDRARVTTLPDPMPRLGLIRDWRVVSPDEALGVVARDDFDPRRTVLLETPPDPAPPPGPSDGVARVLRSATDELEIEADLASPAILLVTDPWAEGWRVTPLSPGPQQAYRLQPADYVLRAVPLAAGRHHLLIHYEQSGLLPGAVLSLSSLVALVGAAFAARRRR
jgi:hypothetical protein